MVKKGIVGCIVDHWLSERETVSLFRLSKETSVYELLQDSTLRYRSQRLFNHAGVQIPGELHSENRAVQNPSPKLRRKPVYPGFYKTFDRCGNEHIRGGTALQPSVLLPHKVTGLYKHYDKLFEKERIPSCPVDEKRHGLLFHFRTQHVMDQLT